MHSSSGPNRSFFRSVRGAAPFAMSSAMALGMAAAPAALADSDAPVKVTFTEHVAPIVFNNCTVCHRAGEAAPFSLASYEEVKKRGPFIVEVTGDRYMPPWHAESGDLKFKAERRLTDAQIDTLEAWVESGMEEGDPEKLPKLPDFPEGWSLGEPDMILTMTEAFEVPAEGSDIYRNFVVPLDIDEDKWVKAIEFRPSAPSVVHHSLFFLDRTGQARARDAESERPGFGRMPRGVERDGYIGGWAVGGRPVPLPEGLAQQLPKGADFIFSTHFHLSGKAESEKSTVGLYFADKPPSKSFAQVQLPPLFGALAAVDIPAGEKAYTRSDYYEFPVDVNAFSVGAHAHYLGKEMELTATLPDGTAKQLLHIKDWDFSWQERYAYEDFVSLPKGTRLDAKVVWDNSTENPDNPSNPPVRVKWGLESTDEMGSITLLITPVDEADKAELDESIRQHQRESAVRSLVANASSSREGRGILAKAREMFDKDKDGKFDAEEREAIKQFLKGVGL